MKIVCEYCGNYVGKEEATCSCCGSVNKYIEKKATDYKYDSNEKKRYVKYDKKQTFKDGWKFVLTGILTVIAWLIIICLPVEIPNEYFEGLYDTLLLFGMLPIGIFLFAKGIWMIIVRK